MLRKFALIVALSAIGLAGCSGVQTLDSDDLSKYPTLTSLYNDNEIALLPEWRYDVRYTAVRYGSVYQPAYFAKKYCSYQGNELVRVSEPAEKLEVPPSYIDAEDYRRNYDIIQSGFGVFDCRGADGKPTWRVTIENGGARRTDSKNDLGKQERYTLMSVLVMEQEELTEHLRQKQIEREKAQLAALIEEERKKAQEARRLKVNNQIRLDQLSFVSEFQSHLKEGLKTNCGPIIGIKGNFFQIYHRTPNGNEHWIERDKILPDYYPCMGVIGTSSAKETNLKFGFRPSIQYYKDKAVLTYPTGKVSTVNF